MWNGLADILRYTIRRSIRTPRLFIHVALVLGLAVGGNAIVFSFLRGTVLTSSSRFPDADRLVRLWHVRATGVREGLSRADFLAWRARDTTCSDMAGIALNGMYVDIVSSVASRRFRAAAVTYNLFDVLGVRPVSGRTFTGQDGVAGSPRVIVLSDTAARQLFGDSRSAIGQPVKYNHRWSIDTYTVVGVVSDDARIYSAARYDVYIPEWADNPTANFVNNYGITIGRLRPGVSLTQSTERLAALARELSAGDPNPTTRRVGAAVEPLESVEMKDSAVVAERLAAAALAVALVTSLNIAALLLTLCRSRAQEFAIQSACGASLARMRAQLVTESAMMGVAGAVIGVVVAIAGLPLLIRVAPPGTPRLEHVQIDPAVVVFACTLALLIALAAGLMSTVGLPGRRLRSALFRGAGRKGPSWTESLVGLQSVVVLGALLPTALVLLSYWRLLHVPLGFDPQRVTAVSVLMDATYTQDAVRYETFQRVLLEKVRQLPEVEDVAATDSLPLHTGILLSVGFQIEGQERRGIFRIVSPSYFALLGIPQRLGNGLPEPDGTCRVLVNERFVERYVPAAHPMGATFVLSGGTCTIHGVVGDVPETGLSREPPPTLYVHMSGWRRPPTLWLLVKMRPGASHVATRVGAAIASLDANLSVESLALEEHVAIGTLANRLYATVLAAFTLLGVVLVALSVFVVAHHAAQERRREIGIRLALGATPRMVKWLFVRRIGAIMLVGTAGGLLAGVWASRAVEHVVFGVHALDPTLMLAAVAVIWTAALVAVYPPARRLASIDPLDTLRCN